MQQLDSDEARASSLFLATLGLDMWGYRSEKECKVIHGARHRASGLCGWARRHSIVIGMGWGGPSPNFGHARRTRLMRALSHTKARLVRLERVIPACSTPPTLPRLDALAALGVSLPARA